MSRPIPFLVKLPIATMMLAVATAGLVAISAPRSESQQTAMASMAPEIFRHISAE